MSVLLSKYKSISVSISYFLPLKTSLNSPGGAWVTKLAAMRTYGSKLNRSINSAIMFMRLV